jgi:hypothetical protein
MIVAARSASAAALAVAVLLGAACGKKGVPIPPRIRIPAAVETITAARLGNDVYVTVTVPATNIDKSIPADISRIDIYGYTGTIAPTPLRWAQLGTVVGTIPVAEIPEPEDDEPLVIPTVPPPSGDALPGSPVTILDRLTADEFVQGQVFVDPRLPALPPLPGAAPPPMVLRRYYLAIPFNRRNRPGPPGAQAEFVLTQLPDPPSGLRAAYSPGGVTVSWDPSGGLIGFLLDRVLPPEPAPFLAAPVIGAAAQVVPDTAVPRGPTTYNVYREVSPDPLMLPLAGTRPPWSAPLPVPMTPPPGAATSVTDIVEFGRTHCYAVRAQRGMVLSEATPRTCFTPIDVFPPAPPAGLAAVPTEGGISLIWEPNAELDLGGYLVLRREPGGATLRQLTPAPVMETRYRDTAVQPGRQYIYSVVAVDTQLPLPNTSLESERVTETAR